MADLAQAADLALDLATSLDPVQVMVRVGLQQDAWQVKALRSRASQALWLCGRQTGKSTIAAIKSVHTALYTPKTLTLLLSPSLRQSSELFRKAMGVYRALGQTVPAEAESALRLELVNGSRIVSLPGTESNIRGFSGVALMVIDEASRVEDKFYYAVRPMLAVSGGKLIALSTPFGKRGFFYEAWENGSNWERTRVVASECPRIGAAFLAEEKLKMGDWWYAQEYLCQFMEVTDALFPFDLVQQAVTDEVEPL